MFDLGGAEMLAASIAVVGLLVLLPLRRSFDDSDKGRGNVVVLPPPRAVSLWRVGAFTVLCLVGSTALIALRSPDLSSVYRSVVSRLTVLVVPEPAVVEAYTSSLRPIIPIAVIAFVVAIAATLGSTPGRRFVLLLHAPLALAASVLADTCLAVFGLETHLPLGPFPMVSILFHYLIAYTLMMRLTVTTYQLPRPTQLPIRRSGNFADNAITVVVLAATAMIVGSLAMWVLHLGPGNAILYAFVLIAIPSYLKFGIYVMLVVLSLFGGRLPQPTDRRPPINVIGPAYNEEINITAWIEAIDRAAGVYGGPVRIILCDDGSTDATGHLAEAAIARCTWATGEVLAGAHRGKSTALNLALTHCTADYVIRHDTDCLVHPNAFLYTVPWLEADPRIGLVGAFMLPKMPFTCWIDRMRALELAAGFGMPRLGYAVIDCQPCVPGNFTAFRRSAALELGGYAEGMFGEDIDFTCNMGRLGYRAVYDRRIWAYEDVPNTIDQLRLQRRRWNRGSIQNFARFIPLAVGSSGPRFWFAEFLKAARRLIMPLQFAAYLFAIQAAILDPSSRLNVIRIVVLYVLAKAPMLVFVILSMYYRGLGRSILYWPLYLFFALIKRLANLEALLTLPTRSLGAPWRARRSRDVGTEELDWPVLRPSYVGGAD
jgi:cellulose synthase/poly-beta-1,6-N-acetylglucosamine synthase-like glycosyltransferase